MKAAGPLYEERDKIVSDLREVWRRLDEVRDRWVQDPLNPDLPTETRALEQRACKLRKRFQEPCERLSGSWRGVDE